MSFIIEAQSTIEELNIFLEVESLNEMKKMLDKFSIVMILRAIHPNFENVKINF